MAINFYFLSCKLEFIRLFHIDGIRTPLISMRDWFYQVILFIEIYELKNSSRTTEENYLTSKTKHRSHHHEIQNDDK